MEFTGNHLILLLIIIVVVVFGSRLAALLKKAKRIDREGIETDAVVSRVERGLDTPDSSGGSYYTYVCFTDTDGEEHECIMSLTPDAQLGEGDRIRIRYIPGQYDMVRHAREA